MSVKHPIIRLMLYLQSTYIHYLLTYGIIGWQNIHSFIILLSLRWHDHDLLLKYLNRNIYFKQCPNWGGWYSLHRKRHYLGRKIFRAGIFFLRVIEVEDLHCGYNATELIFQTILLGTSIVMHCIPIMCQFLEKERKNS